jgi:hypothetical protein
MSKEVRLSASRWREEKSAVSSLEIDELDTEEREEYLRLIDYLEFLNDPQSWYVKREHPSLDG